MIFVWPKLTKFDTKNMFRNFLILSAFSLFLLSCDTFKVEDVNWLNGQWEFAFNQSIEIENWTSKPGEVSGKAYFVNQGDSTIMREMGIIKENGDLILVIQETGFEYISKYNYLIVFIVSE